MSKKTRAYTASKLFRYPVNNRQAFYAGWDAAMQALTGCAECGCKAEDGWTLYCLKCVESQCEWVGLTDANIAQLRREGAHSVSDKDFSAIEAKIKERKA
jgi:hypothetical protein